MNTVVWVMVSFAYSSNLSVGPEFKTQAKCEQAAEVIQKAAVKESVFGGGYRKPFCVQIEK